MHQRSEGYVSYSLTPVPLSSDPFQKMPSVVADPNPPSKLPPPPPPPLPGMQVGLKSGANIGSFRAARDWEDALPSALRNLLGGQEIDY